MAKKRPTTPAKARNTKTAPTKPAPAQTSPDAPGAAMPSPETTPAAPARKPRRRAAARQDRDAPLDILFVTSEARPFAKTGGLADVCSSLPRALARLGHRVTIVLPKYRGAHVEGTGWAADIPFGLHAYPVHFVEHALEDGVGAVLIDAPALYDRAGLYGDSGGDYGDNAFRFAVLCRGALEYARLKGTRPSVIHAHDWQAALAPVYARTVLHDDPIVGGV